MVQRVSLIGAGNLAYVPQILATISQMFGERPIQMVLYDADEERLDLAHRLALRLVDVAQSDTSVVATDNISDALEACTAILLAFDENCAKKFLAPAQRRSLHGVRPSDWAYDEWPTVQPATWTMVNAEEALNALVEAIGLATDSVPMVTIRSAIQIVGAEELDWPHAPSAPEPHAIPHQVLRWARSEEAVDVLLQQNLASPLRTWLAERLN